MNRSSEAFHLKLCLKKIETQLNRGPSEDWVSYDFEKLSIEIENSTGILLSVTTLKRIWGRIKYTNLPAMTTLNTLARFTGSSDWNAFKQGMAEHTSSDNSAIEPKKVREPLNNKFKILVPISLVIIISAIGFYSAMHEDFPSVDYRFSSNKILSTGLPNSVVFNYDIPGTVKDSVFIAQSWDESRKVAVSKHNHFFSSIYYEPGYYKAKLLVRDKVIKEHDVFIASAGWMALAENPNGMPIYFKQQEISRGGKTFVDEDLLAKYNLNKQPSPPLVRMFNVQDIKGINSDNYTFETSVKGNSGYLGAPCQQVEISLLGKGDIISIPLCSKGCIGNLSLYAWGQDVNSNSANLSGFGCDLGNWVKLRQVSYKGTINIFVNGKQAYSLKSTGHRTAIIGVRYSFKGPISVQNTTLSSDKKVVNF